MLLQTARLVDCFVQRISEANGNLGPIVVRRQGRGVVLEGSTEDGLLQHLQNRLGERVGVIGEQAVANWSDRALSGLVARFSRAMARAM